MSGPASWPPARGYSWEPFKPGHVVSLVFGGRSPRVIAALADQLAAELVRQRPDLADFPWGVSAWAHAEARAALFRYRLDEQGDVDEEGKVRGHIVDRINSAERRAAEAARELGLTPRSAAALARERVEAAKGTWDLQALADAGRRALAEGQRRAIEVSGGDDDEAE